MTKEREQVIPRVILLCWECPGCEYDNDIEAGVIFSHIGQKKYGHALIQKCWGCGQEVEINYDDIDI